MADLEIVIWQQVSDVNERRIATARIKDDGAVWAILRDGRAVVTSVMPLGAGESVWGVVERAAEMLSGLEETGA